MKSLLTISLLLFVLNGSYELKAQTFEDTLARVDKQRKFYLDTLDLEYTGPLKEHERIVKRCANYLYENRFINEYTKKTRVSLGMLQANELFFYPLSFEKIIGKPLVSSYLNRIEPLAKAYIEKNYSEKYKSPKLEVCYRLNNGYNKFSFCDQGKDYYSMGVLYYFNFIFTPFLSDVQAELLKMKDNDTEFLKQVSQAKLKGTKEVATVNGFYNKKLELKLIAALLIEKDIALHNEIIDIINSTNETGYKIIHSVDIYKEYDIAKQKIESIIKGEPTNMEIFKRELKNELMKLLMDINMN